jgi:hypothetical protein
MNDLLEMQICCHWQQYGKSLCEGVECSSRDTHGMRQMAGGWLLHLHMTAVHMHYDTVRSTLLRRVRPLIV